MNRKGKSSSKTVEVTETKAQKAGEPSKERLPSLHLLGLADLVTNLNAVFGIASIFLCLNYLENSHYESYIVWAFIMLPLGLICDLLDGYIARRRYSSPFGRDLDSLADLISFGIAPSCLGFTLGLRGIWDSFILCFFVCCVMIRLARFNVTAQLISNEKGKVPYYEGLPSPSSIVIVIMLLVAYLFDRIHVDNVWGGKMQLYPGHFHPLSLVYLIFGGLMISRVRIKKF